MAAPRARRPPAAQVSHQRRDIVSALPEWRQGDQHATEPFAAARRGTVPYATRGVDRAARVAMIRTSGSWGRSALLLPPIRDSSSSGCRGEATPPPAAASPGGRAPERLRIRGREQIGRGVAVDRHEGAVAAPAEPVHRLGEERLAGALLAGDQHRAVRRRCARGQLEQSAHLGIFGHDQGLEAPGAEGGAKPGNFLPQAFTLLGLFEGQQQLVGLRGLADESVGTLAQRGGGQRGAHGAAGHQDDARPSARPVTAQKPENPRVAATQVEQQCLDGARLRFYQRGFRFLAEPHFVPRGLERGTDALAEGIFGIDDENAHEVNAAARV